MHSLNNAYLCVVSTCIIIYLYTCCVFRLILGMLVAIRIDTVRIHLIEFNTNRFRLFHAFVYSTDQKYGDDRKEKRFLRFWTAEYYCAYKLQNCFLTENWLLSIWCNNFSLSNICTPVNTLINYFKTNRSINICSNI